MASMIDKDFRNFYKPEKIKLIIFFSISIFFPTMQILRIMSDPIAFTDLPLIYSLLVYFIFFLIYVDIYAFACILVYLNNKFFPKKHWKIFLTGFLLIFLLANTSGVGTIGYSRAPKEVACYGLDWLGAPTICPEPSQCPPDCCYSTTLRTIFWLKPLSYKQCPGPNVTESDLTTMPINAVLSDDGFYLSTSFKYFWVGGSIIASDLAGLALNLELILLYWYTLALILIKLIVPIKNKIME